MLYHSDMGKKWLQSKKYLPCLLILWAALVYINTLTNGFVFDDEVTIVNNVLIKSPANITKLFSYEYFTLSGEASYRPLVTFTYMIDYAVWGLTPAGYHLTNLLLHILSAYFLYLLLVNLWGERGFALTAAAVFSLTPVNTEAVNAVSFREDLLITPLCLLSLIIHRCLQDPGISGLRGKLFKYGAPLLYFLALLSKEMAITLPLLALVMDYYKDRTLHFKKYTVYLIFTVLYLFIRFYVIINMEESPTGMDAVSMIIFIPSAISFYMRLFLFPINLAADYAGGVYVNPLFWFLPVLAVGLFFRSADSKINISIAWFFVSLIPVLNIAPLKHPMEERYLYFPSIGLSIFLAALAYRFHKTSLKTVSISLFLAAVFLFSLLTFERNGVWESNYSLWTDTIKKMPASFAAHNNLGLHYEKDGRADDALMEYRTALKLNPGLAEARNNIGLIYYRQGMLVEAEKEFKFAIKLKPGWSKGHANLGDVYSKEGRTEDALQEYQIALKLNPNNANTFYSLGLLYNRQGRFDEAVDAFFKALKLDPFFAEAHNGIGNSFLGKGQIDEAITAYKTALKIRPEYADAHNNLGSALFNKGLVDAAINEYREALTIKPDFLDARFNLGLAYWRDGKIDEAVDEFKYILKLDPNYHEADKIISILTSRGHSTSGLDGLVKSPLISP